MSIRFKLLAAFVVTTLVPILIISVITVRQVNQDAKEAFVQASDLDISIVDHSFTNFFNMVGYNVSFMADHPSVRAARSGTLSTYFEQAMKPAEVAKANGGIEQDVFELYSAIGDNNPTLGYVYMANKDGGYLEWPGTAGYGDWDPRTRPWFSIGKDANFSIARRDGYYWEPDDAVYVSVLKGYKNLDGEFEGVVAIDVSLKALTDMVQDIKFGETGFIMVIEGSGNILVDGGNTENNFKALGDLDAPYFQQIASTQSGIVELEIEGVAYLANVYESEGLGWKFVGFKEKSEIYSAARSMMWSTILVSVIVVTIFMIIGGWIARSVSEPINSVKDGLKKIAEGEGDLTTRIHVKSEDETGQLASWFNQFIDSTQQMITRIKDNAESINQVSEQARQSSVQVSSASDSQNSAVEQVATAVTEMTSTANEVAKNCVETASISDKGMEATLLGKQVIDESAQGSERLGASISESVKVIEELEQETENINNILATIQGIAEQTNLLALNAAIEAARAGEQGRGFAVVADEVRNLASRTQDSTGEINSILSSLNSRTQKVSDNMEESLSLSSVAIENSEKVRSAFEEIENAVELIRDMATQNASAAEEQHLVSEEINRNVISINEAASTVLSLSEEMDGYSSEQAQLGQALEQLVSRFRT